MIVALAGGVGGAKLAAGLAAVLPPEALAIVVNTGDDFDHLGLSISPDIDSIVYGLAGISDPVRGWGVAGESWAFMEAMERLGAETWFRLGDRDLATHIERTRRLRCGESLTEATAAIAGALGVRHRVLPMSDAPAPTLVETDEGTLAFQDYFVRRHCAPRITALRYGGSVCTSGFDLLLDDPALTGVIICPSNPYLSIDPILALGGVRERLKALSVPVVAVSPLIAGAAVKGPVAKIMAELGVPTSSAAIAAHYDGLVDGIVVDAADQQETMGLSCRHLVAPILMTSTADKIRVARAVIEWLERGAR
jgi:LPPG:FO 2-phospho-L-lactate transferase